MKALLLKDFYALKESRALLILMAALLAVMLIPEGVGAGVALTYMVMISMVLVINVINYDEADNGYAFLFTLPVSRKAYAVEKYVFGWGTGMAGWILAVVLSELTVPSGPEAGSLRWAGYGAVLALLLIMQAVLIPIQLKFGGQKGRIVLLIISGGAGAAVAIFGSGFEEEAEVLVTALASKITPFQMMDIELAAALAAAGLSLWCSIRIMERKSF